MATIIGDHMGNPGFRDLGDFSQRRKILESKNSHVFRRQIFVVTYFSIIILMFGFASHGALNQDSTVRLEGPRPAKTCIPPSV
jgi:hypothetical protein